MEPCGFCVKTIFSLWEVFAHVAYGRGHLQLEQADDAAALCVELFGFGGEDAQTYAGFFVDEGWVAVDCLGGDNALYLRGFLPFGKISAGKAVRPLISRTSEPDALAT